MYIRSSTRPRTMKTTGGNVSLTNSFLGAHFLELTSVGVSLVELPVMHEALVCNIGKYLGCIVVHLLLNLWLIAGKGIRLGHLRDQNKLALFVRTELNQESSHSWFHAWPMDTDHCTNEGLRCSSIS